MLEEEERSFQSSVGQVRNHQRDRVCSRAYRVVAVYLDQCSLYNKEQEFRAWLVEERMINPETISKDQTKKEFARFVEDYNTGTVLAFTPLPCR